LVWITDPSNLYKKCYRQADPIVQKKVIARIQELVNSPDPRRLADGKSGQLDGEYGVDINKGCRLLFTPVFETNTIELDRMCSHNMSYSKRH
jgi:hypothetical protein